MASDITYFEIDGFPDSNGYITFTLPKTYDLEEAESYGIHFERFYGFPNISSSFNIRADIRININEHTYNPMNIFISPNSLMDVKNLFYINFSNKNKCNQIKVGVFATFGFDDFGNNFEINYEPIKFKGKIIAKIGIDKLVVNI